MNTATSTARERILHRLQAAAPTPLAAPDPAAFYATRPTEALPARVERLANNLSAAMAEVRRTTPARLADDLAQLLSDKAVRTLAIGPELLDNAALCARLQNACTLLPVTTVHEQTPALFNEADAGLTRSHAAIAETGTVVLHSGPRSPRLLSLVPPLHIAIVEAARTVGTLFELMQQENWAAGLPTNVILVSSPSKTADIQQTLAYGAHGPKQFVVMLVEAL